MKRQLNSKLMAAKRTGRNKLEVCKMAFLAYLSVMFIVTIVTILITDNSPKTIANDNDNDIFENLGIPKKTRLNYPSNGCQQFLKNKTTNHLTRLYTTKTCPKKYELIILVTSHMHNYDRRMTIRNTWGVDKYDYKTYFVVGTTNSQQKREMLSCEDDFNNDIIYGEVTDDFFNLSYKIQYGFEWAIKYCNFTYLLKANDDVFVNIPLLLGFLHHEETPKVMLYAGNVQYQAAVLRMGRNNVTKKEYWKKYYPRYCSGSGFVLTHDVVTRMVSHFRDAIMIKKDDAYVGELALKSNVDVFHDGSFVMDRKRCMFHKKIILHHPVKSDLCMRYLFMKQQFGIVS